MKEHLEILDSGVLYANPYQGDWAINAYYPTTLQIGPNEILCVYKRSAAMYSDDGRSYQLRSTDNGRTWQDEGPVWDGSTDERTYSYSATCLAMTGDGEIVLSGFRFHRPKPDMLFYNEQTGACIPEETILFRSRDRGRTWSAPEIIQKPTGKYLEITASIVELNDGRWLIPFDVSKDYYDPTPSHPYVVALCSSDRGRTWNELIPLAGGPHHEKTFWHCRVIKLADGRLITFPWTGDGTGQKFLNLHRTVSDPTGRHWSQPQPTNVHAQTNWPVDLGDGRMALVYTLRDAAQPGIYAALSHDEGKSWDTDNQVRIWDAYGKESLGVARTATYPSSHDNIAYGAPHAIRLHDGDILASFWAGQSGQMTARWCKLHVKNKTTS